MTRAILKCAIVAIFICIASQAIGENYISRMPWDRTWVCNYIITGGPEKGSEDWVQFTVTSEIKKGHIAVYGHNSQDPRDTSVRTFYFVVQGQDAYLNDVKCK